MTRTRAPGKVVVSGAYSVLEGAPAVVVAVGRYAFADTERPPSFVTDEVRAAFGEAPAPFIDASEQRAAGRKLGLGSSAAILVASLYARERARGQAGGDGLRRRVFELALAAHRAAQGGGSGVDVASSSFGGVLGYRLVAGEPELESLTLPSATSIEVWACPEAASTPRALGLVRELRAREAALHARLLGAQAEASSAAERALRAGDAHGFVAALRAQARALFALGQAAGFSIVTPELHELEGAAEAEGGALLPAGAGGGDLSIFVGPRASSSELRGALERRGHALLAAPLGVGGVDELPSCGCAGSARLNV